MEQWKQVYEGFYEISSSGRLRRDGLRSASAALSAAEEAWKSLEPKP